MKSALLIVTLLLAWAEPAVPHPLGNTTVNRQAALHVAPDRVDLRYLVDLAEIPTLVQQQEADANGDSAVSEVEWSAHAERWATEISRDLVLELDGAPRPVTLRDPRWTLVPGAAGLFTLRLEAFFTARLDRPIASLRYLDRHRPAQIGWKEIYVESSGGVRIERASVPQADRSRALTEFPEAPAADLPNELSATAELALGGTTGGLSSVRPSTGSGQTVPGAQSPETVYAASTWARAWAFFKLGLHHIATGWDHLVFLLGLLLLRQSLGHLVKVITAFTLAHSLTLALAANGWVTPPGSLVEPAIALTIAYVGAVSLVWRECRHSAWLAFGFGLVHGFGFAGALAESLAGQPAARGDWLLNLASFNLGIEAFQLLLVCALVPAMAFAARFAWSGAAARASSFGVFAAGIGLLVGRVGSL
jgi:hypothetical protein